MSLMTNILFDICYTEDCITIDCFKNISNKVTITVKYFLQIENIYNETPTLQKIWLYIRNINNEMMKYSFPVLTQCKRPNVEANCIPILFKI